MKPDELADTSPPIPNSYWVQPGRLLAGEYPGSMSRAEAMERVQKLLRAGVASFIDLTEEGELPEYENLLPGLTEQHVRYRRLPIVDHGLPDSPADMSRILDSIGGELAAGRCVYVHCHAGIGRTGMAVGCHLIRSGLGNEDALARLQVLWRQSARSRRWPSVPETSEQVAYVRQWRESAHAAGNAYVDTASRYQGALVGLAVGDALGTLVATSNFDAATLAARMRDPGALATGSNTAMTRALAESLLAQSAHDPKDQMQRYLQWSRGAEGLAVPGDLKRALAAWQWSKKANAGSHDPKNLDPHSLPRTVAVALFMQADPQGAIDTAAEVSRTTQQSPAVLDLCRTWAGSFVDALSGADKAVLVGCTGPAMQCVRKRTLKAPVKSFIDGRARHEVETANDAIAVSHVAMAAFAATSTFRDALIRVETATRAAPAAAALCGALAGAHYGIDAIPLEWRRQLTEEAALRSLARHLLS